MKIGENYKYVRNATGFVHLYASSATVKIINKSSGYVGLRI
jgi:hypothetical protein